MTVLVVDDDSGARALMRRVLVRDFNAHVIEADDGVTGLERLLAEPVDLLLLDIKMRVMDGLRTLEAVRRSPKYSQLPVVMLTGLADQERVARAMQLGVTDFIVKPLVPAALRARLSRVLGDVQVEDKTLQLELEAKDRVIVLDRDAAFRDFFAEALTLCHVETADSELVALKQCQTGPLAAVVVGIPPGLLDVQVFIQTLRGAARSVQLPVIAAVRSADLEETRRSALYDAVIVRSFDLLTWTRSLARLLGEPTRARLLFEARSPQMTALLDVIARQLSEALRQTISVGDDMHPSVSGSARWLFGALTLQCPDSAWELRLHLPFAVALQVAADARRVTSDDLSESQVIGVVGELTTRLGEQLRDDVRQYGLTAPLSVVRMGTLPSAGAAATRERSSDVTRCLLDANADPVAVVQLRPRASGAHVRPRT